MPEEADGTAARRGGLKAMSQQGRMRIEEMGEMTGKSLAFVAATLLPWAWAGAEPTKELAKVRKEFGPPVMWVAQPAKAPVIDGRLDEDAWSAAAPVTLGFLCGRWETPSQKTEARVLADAKAVYVAVRCFEAQPDRIIAAGNQRDGDLWNGDTVEIFLDPGHTERRLNYYHLIVNPKGLVYDGKGKDPKAWNASVQAAGGRFDGGWTVELAVPMADLGVAGAVPRVWGLNVNRQRPELGRPTRNYPLTPSIITIPDPGNYREGEDTSWSPTWCESSHVCQRFGHAVLAAGTVAVKPPQRLFDLIYKSGFDGGDLAGFSGAKIVEDSFRGPGKCIAPKDGSGAIQFDRPLRDMDDVTLIYALKMNADGRLYYYGRAPDSEQCEADRHEVFLTAEAADARKWAALDEWSTHASKMAWRSHGRRRLGPGPWAMMTGHFSEPSIGSVMSPGTDWVLVRTRLGMLRRQRSQGLVPMTQDYPRGLTFASGEPYQMDEVIVFRGADLEPPDRVAAVQVRPGQGASVSVSWARANDNTITAWYDVLADGKSAAQTHRLSAEVPSAAAAGKAITVVAVDLYGNRSTPSAPVKAGR
ncbi:MAG TPA: sugar-binding protein [Phycisphaerae bacterium]|nr:sugar-binding protein [Phycisphaerae bacterium]